MINNRNSSRRPTNFRNTPTSNSQTNFYNFVGMAKPQTENIEDMPLAMAYIPFQKWRNLYDPNEAFQRGTIFKELDLPFECAKECK